MWPRILVCIAEKQSRLKRLKNFSHRKMFLKMLFQMLAVCYPIALNLPLVVPCSKLKVIFKVLIFNRMDELASSVIFYDKVQFVKWENWVYCYLGPNG